MEVVIFSVADTFYVYVGVAVVCLTLTDFQTESPIFLNFIFHYSKINDGTCCFI